MGTAAATRTDERGAAEETLWDEVRRVARPIIVDIAIFILILSAILLGTLALRVLESVGYEKERLHTLDLMHYWFYAGVYTLFGFDLLFKIALALFFRKKHGQEAPAA